VLFCSEYSEQRFYWEDRALKGRVGGDGEVGCGEGRDASRSGEERVASSVEAEDEGGQEVEHRGTEASWR
jgi:hypothetical protein